MTRTIQAPDAAATASDTAPLSIERVDVSSLRQHPQNPRRGSLPALRESLMVNGQYKPVVIARDGTILAGNHTVTAAFDLGWTHVSAVRLDVDPESPAARRILLADNRIGDLGTYEDTLLLDLLQHLSEGAGIEGTGYVAEDLEALDHLLGDEPAAGGSSPAAAAGVSEVPEGAVRVALLLSPEVAAEFKAALRDLGPVHDDVALSYLAALSAPENSR